MIFPYFKGMVFCAKLTNEGGWAAIDEVYRNPPLSTEQILHPEKYRAKPDYPDDDRPGRAQARRRLEGSRPQRPGRDADWRSCSASTAAKAAAAGWDGDRYAVFEGPKNKLGLVWLSTWDSEDDAREFAHGYVAYQTAKVGNLGKPPKPIPDSVWRNLRRSDFTSSRDAGATSPWSRASRPRRRAGLVDAAFRAKQTEMKPGEPKKERAKTGAEKVARPCEVNQIA